MDYFNTVKNHLLEMGFSIDSENEAEELCVINDEERGINNLVVDCEDPILILEQVILKINKDDPKFHKRLLQLNRSLVHGAYALDEDGKILIFRDTLQLENLDRNELEGSIDALSLAMAEHGSELLEFAKSQ
ncbi:MAG: YbjN domain-containing protein [Candidatus Nitrohelix vancouverensis]|uniref:YbjN domain-containing protein n=1 Tax=Candidatus Nitrohelix vancouverensis TaxID=2705534 RepID=A0A7T0G387_9BACT|nr:MAG: YbjN domain-containing protein [Candidatus Nitrohelix vancouverensis]